MSTDAVVTTVRGEGIYVSDVIVQMKLKGLFRMAIYELIEQRVLRQMLGPHGLSVSEEDVDRRVEVVRREQGIATPDLFEKYLSFQGITADQWRESVRVQVIAECLKQHLISPRRITESYRRDPLRFASVSIARIVCRAREEVERVLAAAREGQHDFVELARRFSADESTRLSGGYIGNVRRGMLPSDVEQQAFESADNTVIGPFRENALWTVYKVYAVNVPKLTDVLKNVIRDQLFSEWLREQVCTVPA